MTETRQNKASEVKFKTTRNVLAFGPKIQAIHRKQTTTIQVHTTAPMNIWYTAMGLYKTIKHKNNSKISIQILALSN
jgi:hypothetical protein